MSNPYIDNSPHACDKQGTPIKDLLLEFEIGMNKLLYSNDFLYRHIYPPREVLLAAEADYRRMESTLEETGADDKTWYHFYHTFTWFFINFLTIIPEFNEYAVDIGHKMLIYSDKVNGDDIPPQIHDINVLCYVCEAAKDYKHALEIRLKLIQFYEEVKDEEQSPYSYDEEIKNGYKAIANLYGKLGDEKAARSYLLRSESAYPQRHSYTEYVKKELDHFSINPWLAEKLKEYRSRHSDEELRRNYETECALGVSLSWDEYHQSRALYEAMRWDPFLRTLRANMDLDVSTRERLYNFHIDCVADLLQVSDEELASCSIHGYLDLKGIKIYLRKHGYKLYSAAERTYKIPSLPVLASLGKCEWNTWLVSPPGRPVEFDLSRPTLAGKWFDEYYARYEHLDGEEKFQKEFAKVKPRFPHGEMPKEYLEFFQALGYLYESYKALCISQHISPKFFRPRAIPDSVRELKYFPNRNFLYLWQQSCQTVIDIFERTNLFRHSSAGKFLAVDMEEKLKIAEEETHDYNFQLLLVTIVELRIDMEDIIILLDETVSSPDREEPTPVNPWMEQVIMEYRQKHSDEYIRKRYTSYLADRPETPWDDFLAAVSLEYKVHREPFLITHRREFGFSEHLQDVMNVMEIDIVADMLQFTIEEMSDFCAQDEESVAPVVQFLSAHGYKLLSYPENTLKYPLPEIEDEKERNLEVIKDQCCKAKTCMSRAEEPLKIRLEKALDTYRNVLDLARKSDQSLKAQLDVLVDLGRLMEEHIDGFPELTEDAPEIAERAVYCSVLVRGPKAKWTAGCHRLYGSILSKRKRHEEAAAQYTAAVEIARVNDGPEGLWVGKDFRSAGVCYSRIPDYQMALEMLFQAANVFQKHPDEPRELEETYWNIAECYKQLKDKENEEKYRLLAVAIGLTDDV